MIKLGPLPQHLGQTAGLRAVRVILGLAAGVVLAVDAHPLGHHHAGGDPGPETEEMAENGVQVQGAVRLAAMEKDRNGDDGHMGQGQGDKDELPPGQVQKAVMHRDTPECAPLSDGGGEPAK